jgi:predicted pyridoxine 5'-phosphate oxidase superfamily flavin-nucleotide-binding protein
MFADICSPGTIRNLLSNSSIEINIVDVFVRKGYRFKGTGRVLSSGPLFEEVAAFYKNGGARFPIKNIVLVKVEQIAPIISPVYDTGMTEPEVKSRWVEYWKSIHTPPEH